MTDTHQLQQDLHFVRQVVDQADQVRPRPVGIYWLWAVYVLIGCCLVDAAPRWAGWYFLGVWPIGYVASVWIGSRHRRAVPVKPLHDRSRLFWWGGSILLMGCCFGIAWIVPATRGPVIGQISIMLAGMFYFLAGIHYDRNFLWLGPVLFVCGLLVGFVPHFGWSALGIIFALGLVLPTLFAPRPPTLEASTVAQ